MMKKNIGFMLATTLLSLSAQQIQAQVVFIDLTPNPQNKKKNNQTYYNDDTLI